MRNVQFALPTAGTEPLAGEPVPYRKVLIVIFDFSLVMATGVDALRLGILFLSIGPPICFLIYYRDGAPEGSSSSLGIPTFVSGVLQFILAVILSSTILLLLSGLKVIICILPAGTSKTSSTTGSTSHGETKCEVLVTDGYQALPLSGSNV